MLGLVVALSAPVQASPPDEWTIETEPDDDKLVAQRFEKLRANPFDHKQWRALEQARRTSDAIAAYREAVRTGPQVAVAHNNLGLALLRAGDAHEAVPNFREALRLDPSLADAHFNLGHALRAAGDPAEALVHFREAARLNPSDRAFRDALEEVVRSVP